MTGFAFLHIDLAFWCSCGSFKADVVRRTCVHPCMHAGMRVYSRACLEMMCLLFPITSSAFRICFALCISLLYVEFCTFLIFLHVMQLVFLFFTGEAWGYLGSRRFLYELDLHSDSVSGLNETSVEMVIS